MLKKIEEAQNESVLADIGITALKSIPLAGELVIKLSILRACQYESRYEEKND